MQARLIPGEEALGILVMAVAIVVTVLDAHGTAERVTTAARPARIVVGADAGSCRRPGQCPPGCAVDDPSVVVMHQPS